MLQATKLQLQPVPPVLTTSPIHTTTLHTTGEPTRIVTTPYHFQLPSSTKPTLLSLRHHISKDYDHLRRIVVHEPRGHRDMYGALLVPETELTASCHGQEETEPTIANADIGVLFLTATGYSTMCGHATLALGRFLIDLPPNSPLFPQRKHLRVKETGKTGPEIELRLHAPCGVVGVKVPVKKMEEVWRSDPSRRISYLGVGSWCVGLDVEIGIPNGLRWPELSSHGMTLVKADVAYGGAFYLILSVEALGFEGYIPSMKNLSRQDLESLSTATQSLKRAFNDNEELRTMLRHPEHRELEFLYGVIVTDTKTGVKAEGTLGAETGLCFFADQQVDRSPTGSGVQARVAVAVVRGERQVGESWTYHSPVSNAFGGEGGFVGTPVSVIEDGDKKVVNVEVEGKAYYTGNSSFVVEEGDVMGEGFVFDQMRG
ncbi:Diaminopimelate epimerase-like protein [Saccharata proteae CBS 121410]|uniref:trans-L-3-hydroxyproline dehydratase n=1 Tax=Saccharata proteae CBS 121410 TaxID=1314787 RepID=A0A9P4HTW1_9PEZI|nr:Diaminopimelate epimerase-like protein [Saccharata proteae CBS 121410]